MKEKELKIIESILVGDNDKVLAYLYEVPLAKVRKYVLSNSGSLDDANDIFQDAVIALFYQVKKGKYNTDYDLDGFLFRVAKNAWIDKKRKENKFRQEEIQADFIGEAVNDHLGEMIEKEKLSVFYAVFSKLEQKCQDLLRYSTFEKRSMKEIRDLMGYKHENVVKSQHYRCKKYFTELLNQNGEALKILRH